MSFTQTLELIWRDSGSNTLIKSFSPSDNAEDRLSWAVTDSSTDDRMNVAIDVSTLELFYLVSDQAVTVETNDASNYDDQLTLQANRPILWYDGIGVAIGSLLTADITALYVTNASGSTANLELRTLKDSTP